MFPDPNLTSFTVTTGMNSVTVDSIDSGTGLQVFTVVNATNAIVTIPVFTPGTFAPVTATYTIINPGLPVDITLRATNQFHGVIIRLRCGLVTPTPTPTPSPCLMDGSLDPTFDNDGSLTTDFGTTNDQAFAVAVQPDGKIVVAGRAFIGGTTDFALARYNPDGSLDTSFDTDGKVTTDFLANNDIAQAVALQPDGKIVVAGFARVPGNRDNFALARYNPNGSLDTSFETDGKVIPTFGSSDEEAFAVAVQADGKIVAAGIDSNADFALVRLNQDGTLDTSFDTDGKVMTAFGSGGGEARAIALQADGKIVVAGFTALNIIDFALARYNPNGSLDTSFDIDGKVTYNSGATDLPYGVAVQPDGKIVVAGTVQIQIGFFEDFTRDFQLIRYGNCPTVIPTTEPPIKIKTSVLQQTK